MSETLPMKIAVGIRSVSMSHPPGLMSNLPNYLAVNALCRSDRSPHEEGTKAL